MPHPPVDDFNVAFKVKLPKDFDLAIIWYGKTCKHGESHSVNDYAQAAAERFIRNVVEMYEAFKKGQKNERTS